jgi:hypothetical protein
MAKLTDELSTLKRLQNRYRLVVMNDDTYEEVVTFKLNRLSVYIALCTIFVVLVGLTVALIVFTPLKYYIPGYGSQAERREMANLKIRADSLEANLRNKQVYWDNIRNVLAGKLPEKLDTVTLDLPDVEKTED